MAKYVGPCPQCQHTHGLSSCSTCGGGTGYPAGVIAPEIDPCLQCAAGIGIEPPVDPEAPTEVIDHGAIAGQLNNFASTELTDAQEVEQILSLGDATADELPQYRTTPDVVAELVPRQASYRELWSIALSRLGLIASLDQGAADYAAREALAMCERVYRGRLRQLGS